MHSSGLRTGVRLLEDPLGDRRDSCATIGSIEEAEGPQQMVDDIEAGCRPERLVRPQQAQQAVVLGEAEWIALPERVHFGERDADVLVVELVEQIRERLGSGPPFAKRQPMPQMRERP